MIIQQCIGVVYKCGFELCDKRLFFDHIKLSRRIDDFGELFEFGNIKLVNNSIIEIAIVYVCVIKNLML